MVSLYTVIDVFKSTKVYLANVSKMYDDVVSWFGAQVKKAKFLFCKDESHKTLCSRAEITALIAWN